MKLIGPIKFYSNLSALVLVAGMLCLAGGCSDSAPVSAAKPAAPKSVVKTNGVQAVTLNQSAWETNAVFDINPATRRDPFFPGLSQRGLANVATPLARPRIESFLILKSIIGAGARRCAGINDRTFMAGETASVRISSGDLVRVKCLEISDRSVVVTVEGDSEPKTLKLNQ